MYLLFRYKNWKPSDYFDLPEADKKITKLFLKQEIEERKEEMEGSENG